MYLSLLRGLVLWLTLCVCIPILVQARTKSAVVHVYPSYGNDKEVWIYGRVLRYSKTVHRAQHTKSSFRQFLAGIRRFTRRALHKSWLDVEFAGQRKRIKVGARGYFKVRFYRPPMPARQKQALTSSSFKAPCQRCWVTLVPQPPKPCTPLGAQLVTATLIAKKSRSYEGTGYGFVLRPHKGPGLSVISDLDDTLLVTNVANKLKMLKGVFLRGGREVSVVPHSLSFIRALLRGPTRRGHGTLHYLSGSPKELYDRMMAIFQHHHFPAGSLSLKQINGHNKYSLLSQDRYKTQTLRRIFRHYPQRQFVLIGDDTEHDPEIYTNLHREFPKQVRAIFIRLTRHKKTPSPSRFRGIHTFRDYREAHRIAQRLGLLPASPTTRPSFRLDKK